MFPLHERIKVVHFTRLQWSISERFICYSVGYEHVHDRNTVQNRVPEMFYSLLV
jgi:hypothetical protein